jgi:hypothetical protein
LGLSKLTLLILVSGRSYLGGGQCYDSESITNQRGHSPRQDPYHQTVTANFPREPMLLSLYEGTIFQEQHGRSDRTLVCSSDARLTLPFLYFVCSLRFQLSPLVHNANAPLADQLPFTFLVSGLRGLLANLVANYYFPIYRATPTFSWGFPFFSFTIGQRT